MVSELAKRSPHRCNVKLSRAISQITKFRQCSKPSLNLHLHIVTLSSLHGFISNSKQTDGGRHFSALSVMPRSLGSGLSHALFTALGFQSIGSCSKHLFDIPSPAPPSIAFQCRALLVASSDATHCGL